MNWHRISTYVIVTVIVLSVMISAAKPFKDGFRDKLKDKEKDIKTHKIEPTRCVLVNENNLDGIAIVIDGYNKSMEFEDSEGVYTAYNSCCCTTGDEYCQCNIDYAED